MYLRRARMPHWSTLAAAYPVVRGAATWVEVIEHR